MISQTSREYQSTTALAASAEGSMDSAIAKGLITAAARVVKHDFEAAATMVRAAIKMSPACIASMSFGKPCLSKSFLSVIDFRNHDESFHDWLHGEDFYNYLRRERS